MKRLFSLFTAALAIACAYAQHSKVVTDTIKSDILGVERAYNVYLPAGYDASNHYPVLYLLHGKGGCHLDWAKNGHVKEIADRLIKSGQAEPMVIVMPDAGEDYTPGKFGYFNFPGWEYETFFFDELMPQAEAKYNIGGEKGQRALAGLSMGGGGTTAYAQKHPDLFSSAYAMSALMELPDGRLIRSEEDYYNKTVSDNDCIAFVENASPETADALRSIKWYVDCGDDDFLFAGNIGFYNAMRKAGIPCELRVRDGGHDWEYWRTALYDALPFASQSFAK